MPDDVPPREEGHAIDVPVPAEDVGHVGRNREVAGFRRRASGNIGDSTVSSDQSGTWHSNRDSSLVDIMTFVTIPEERGRGHHLDQKSGARSMPTAAGQPRRVRSSIKSPNPSAQGVNKKIR